MHQLGILMHRVSTGRESARMCVRVRVCACVCVLCSSTQTRHHTHASAHMQACSQPPPATHLRRNALLRNSKSHEVLCLCNLLLAVQVPHFTQKRSTQQYKRQGALLCTGRACTASQIEKGTSGRKQLESNRTEALQTVRGGK